MSGQRDSASEIREMFVKEPLANWNGAIMPLSEVRVSVLDRAFLFGDAIYEVIRIYNGKPFLFQEHVSRLEKSIEKMGLAANGQSIAARIQETISASDVESGIVYVQVTRGVAPRSHRYPDSLPKPNELIYVSEFNDPYLELRETGAAVIIQDDLRWKRCDLKSVNLLANCMAAQAAHEAGCADALFVNTAGELVEGSRTSLFGVRNGTILTAPLGKNILPGITRKLLMDLAEKSGVELREETLHSERLSEIDELFLTGTTTEILPITAVDDQPIGSGEVGPVVQRLLVAYKNRIAEFSAL
ncbi:D-amino acid aminotransferase [Planctomicrobium sp.]|jgi:D-alanine transaminase|nr:D-amino acid aminotransferase [Planctomicrobium sp.]MBT5017274.1 D-amino acid aminotransferase [Planctomicrobium sp.]MDA7527357.1 D-amino acid aminotransferase [bacterium]MDB4733152.1 D-amino acid aminotransferase [Planctomicrobium sp.]MDB4743456.1 D-amino acid aminotransferase [Planctomicrobium sp.]